MVLQYVKYRINVNTITFNANVNVSMTIFNQNIRGTVKRFPDSLFAKKKKKAPRMWNGFEGIRMQHILLVPIRSLEQRKFPWAKIQIFGTGPFTPLEVDLLIQNINKGGTIQYITKELFVFPNSMLKSTENTSRTVKQECSLASWMDLT